MATDPGQTAREWFHPRTLILGWGKNNERGPAGATFVFSLPQNIFSKGANVEASLMIEAERNHGGLHSHLGPRLKSAIIAVNGETVDQLWLIDRMLQGEDYGYRNIGPIPLDIKFLKGEKLTVTLKIEEQMSWDIDRVVVQITKGSRRLTVLGSMIAGALISAAAGLLPSAINGAQVLIMEPQMPAVSSPESIGASNQMSLSIPAFIVNVLTLLAVGFAAWVYYRQLNVMQETQKAQNMATLVQYLQAPEVRKARGIVLGGLKDKNYTSWSDEDREEAATALAAYGTAGVLIKLKRVDLDPILENWGPSIKEIYETCKPLISERRERLGNKYWENLTWLYEEVKKSF